MAGMGGGGGGGRAGLFVVDVIVLFFACNTLGLSTLEVWAQVFGTACSPLGRADRVFEQAT